MLWNIAFVGYFFVVVGALVFGFVTVQAQRQDAAAQTRDFHVRSLDCLARNVYYEARGESLAGQYAVAEVTMNRLASSRYPDSVCAVVHEQRWDELRGRYVAAFSWTEFYSVPEPEGEAWALAQKVAADVYHGRAAPRAEGATFYHSDSIRPSWARTQTRVARIGRHVFYR
ncbi:MAG TPA: cell wall hydrolase [Burkholderiales bacterium]|nr:cell wall hydrolase [Burkholderiales bacterium]